MDGSVLMDGSEEWTVNEAPKRLGDYFPPPQYPAKVVPGRDRIAGTAVHDGLSDELWEEHKEELMSRYAAGEYKVNGVPKLGFENFCALFAEPGGKWTTDAMNRATGARVAVSPSSGGGGADGYRSGDVTRSLIASVKGGAADLEASYTDEQRRTIADDDGDDGGESQKKKGYRFGDLTRSLIEKIRSGAMDIAFFTDEQRASLGVDASGKPLDPPPPKKSDWPELVGATGEAAVATIKVERPDLAAVEALAEDSMVTMDYREDRVRVFVAASGTVSKPPAIG